MVLYEVMGIKRFIQLIIKQFIDKNIENSHQTIHHVLADKKMGGYRVKVITF